MASPSKQALPASWVPVLEGVSQWAMSDGPSGVAHIQGPRASGKSTMVPPSLARPVIYATNAADVQRIGPDSGPLVRVGTYGNITNAIANSELTDEAILLIHVDQCVTAEFAMAMALAQLWTTSQPKARLVTMSSEPPAPWMLRLFKVDSVQTFVLPEHRANPQVVSVSEDVDILQFVASRVPPPDHPDGSHAIVCFPPTLPRVQLSAQERDGVRFPEVKDGSTPEAIRMALTCREECRMTAISVAHADFPCARLSKFDHIHIIVGSQRTSTFLDTRTGTQVALTVLISESEHRDRIAWAYRSDTPLERVTVYVQPARRARQRRTEVENRQVAGFFCFLAETSVCRADFDPMAAARAFVPTDMVRLDVLLRLSLLRILAKDALEYHPEMPLGTMRGTFLKVLHMVNYDPAVALLVATASVHPWEATVKLQLAAMLTVGIDKIFEDLGPDGHPSWDTNLLFCIGCTKSMAKMGSWWLLLGLWKKAVVHFRFNANGSVYEYLSETEMVGLASVVFAEVGRALRLVHQLGAVTHVEVRDPADEPNELSDAAQASLLQSVVKAFHSHTVVVNDSVPAFISLKGSFLTYPSPQFASGFDLPTIRGLQTQGEMMFGVSYTLSSVTHAVEFDDWTWIPSHMFFAWMDENGEWAHDPQGLLKTRTDRVTTGDEVVQEDNEDSEE